MGKFVNRAARGRDVARAARGPPMRHVLARHLGREPLPGACANCGYDLRNRCPECGMAAPTPST